MPGANFAPEAFDQAHTIPFQFEGERHDIAMREAVDTIRLTGEGGQQFSGLHLNRDHSGKPAIVRFGAWLSASNGPEAKYAAYQYAAANPDHPVLLVDMPAHGLSDRATSEQRREIFLSRRLSRIASSQAVAVSNRLPSASEVILLGDSLGGRVAPDVAIQAGRVGLKPVMLLGFDIAGVDERPSLGIAKAFFVDEAKTQRNYRQGADNERLDKAYEVGFKQGLVKDESYKLYSVYFKDLALIALIFARSPLASRSGFDSIEEALSVNPELLAAFVSGGLSKISRLAKIQHEIDQLTARQPRLTWDVWPNDSHSMGLAPQQPRFARYTQAKIATLL